jgi:hypothetical protein
VHGSPERLSSRPPGHGPNWGVLPINADA